jgi:hypothetical protein
MRDFRHANMGVFCGQENLGNGASQDLMTNLNSTDIYKHPLLIF